VLSPIWIALLIGEIPGPLSMMGFAIVIAAITIWLVSDAKAATKRLQPK
jgi:hypothetical protein